jgi:hypothetical protein
MMLRHSDKGFIARRGIRCKHDASICIAPHGFATGSDITKLNSGYSPLSTRRTILHRKSQKAERHRSAFFGHKAEFNDGL